MSDEPDDRSGDAPSAKRRVSCGGRRAVAGALLLVAVTWLGFRSLRGADVLAVAGPSGKVGGLATFDGRLLGVMSNLDAGAERAWTAQTFVVPPTEARQLTTTAVDPATARVAQQWGFAVASKRDSAFGLPGTWQTTVAVPLWVFLPVGAWPVVRWGVRRGQAWRRGRRGWCLGCGYDLRGAAGGRCPECGAAPVTMRGRTRQVSAGA
jgi:hypothetical protein